MRMTGICSVVDIGNTVKPGAIVRLVALASRQANDREEVTHDAAWVFRCLAWMRTTSSAEALPRTMSVVPERTNPPCRPR